jgi:hypothetical protein
VNDEFLLISSHRKMWHLEPFQLNTYTMAMEEISGEELNGLFIRHLNSCHASCFYCCCNVCKKSNGNNDTKFWEELVAYFHCYGTGHIENYVSKNSSIVSYVFVTAVMFLPSRYLATIGGFLPSSCLATIRGTQRHTHTDINVIS